MFESLKAQIFLAHSFLQSSISIPGFFPALILIALATLFVFYTARFLLEILRWYLDRSGHSEKFSIKVDNRIKKNPDDGDFVFVLNNVLTKEWAQKLGTRFVDGDFVRIINVTGGSARGVIRTGNSRTVAGGENPEIIMTTECEESLRLKDTPSAELKIFRDSSLFNSPVPEIRLSARIGALLTGIGFLLSIISEYIGAQIFR